VHKALVDQGLASVAFHRETHEPGRPGRRSMPSVLTDIEEVVLGCDVLGPVVVVASGTACLPALCYAGLHPDTVRGVVAVQPVVTNKDSRLLWLQGIQEASKQVPWRTRCWVCRVPVRGEVERRLLTASVS
jgi:hypothetical protein